MSTAPSPAQSDGATQRARIVVVMGVSSSGKSVVGKALARKLHAPFLDGDQFHPPANKEKMRAGIPLTDEDRWPWLAAIAGWLATCEAGGIIACSALRRAYRDRLRAGVPEVRFVHLDGEWALIAARQAARPGHFMPASLIESQFAALEPPDAEEAAISVSVVPPAEAVVASVLRALGAAGFRAASLPPDP